MPPYQRSRSNPRAAWLFTIPLGLLAGVVPVSAQSNSRDTAAQRLALHSILAAEDARGTQSVALAPVFAALRANQSEPLLIYAVRALGRLERASLLDSIIPFLSHPRLAVRIEAANALAQATQAATVIAAPPPPPTPPPPRPPPSPRPIATAQAPDTIAILRAWRALLSRLESPAGVLAPRERGVLARSLGRLAGLPPGRAESSAVAIARSVQPSALAAWCSDGVRHTATLDHLPPELLFGALHGLYSIARRTRSLPCEGVSTAYAALRFGRAGSGGAPNARALPAWIRELALLALQAANAADSSAVRLASQDPHPLVRRLALRSSDLLGGAAPQLLRGLLADRSAPVRLDAVRALAATATRAGGEPWPGACAASHRLLSDAAAHVRLEAIDAVAAACTEPVGPAGPAALDSLVKLLPRDTLDARSSWHAPARALVALSRRDGRRATAHFTRFSGHPVWQVRAALADAARSIGDTALLLRLLDDKDANVREEVIGHLAALGGELRERGVQRGLASDDYQVVLAAARAAKDVPSVAVPSLAQALARLTRHRHETSRDPRRELLERIAERGAIEHADLIRPYVTDFDTLIARRAAEVMSLWTGQLVRPQATPLPLPGEPLGDVARQRGLFLRITLSPAYGSGSFLVRLTADETPATVARIVRLARSGAYNGRTFHRVVPNFVIQGGSPDANEYVGDGPFMRDELGLRSHTRGTLGISTRGRDTGDAQIFVNVVNNFRLDHDYTVFGEVIEGMAVVDRIQTGAVMAAVEVLQRRR